MTNKRKFNSKQATELLALIHTDVCGPFPVQTICGNSYFVTFIDDFSRFCILYLISEKSQVLDVFKIFKTEVERQTEKLIKVVRSDRGGEYYGRYSEKGQHKGPFAAYLEQCGIVAQYTTPYTPEQNGVCERRNRTLMNMVRSMFSRSGLPRFLWGEALKTANYICNRTPSKSINNTPFENWNGYKPSLNHLHVWGCKAEARVYNGDNDKLEPKSESAYFIGYSEKSKGFKFYNHSRHTRIFETNRAAFFDEFFDTNDEMMDSAQKKQYFNMDEWFVYPELVQQNTSATIQSEVPSVVVENQIQDVTATAPIIEEIPQEVNMETQEVENTVEQQVVAEEYPVLRRSERARRPAISGDYHLYAVEFDLGEDDPTTLKAAMKSQNSHKWRLAMEDELQSMSHNGVWILVDKTEDMKPIGCKWVYKTKRDAEGKIERYKARLVAKGYNQKEGIDYNETFSPVSTKDAFRVIMALTAHFDLELHQMDVKTAFLNGNLEENLYMLQPDGFVEDEKKVCKLQKSIYGLKQASRQWYLKFDAVITSFGFEENKLDECVYCKISGSHFIFLVLYVDDILLASSDFSLLKATKEFLMKSFDMKDMGEAHYVLGIEIKRDRKRNMLGLSQKNYIDRVLQRFGMDKCRGGSVPMSKGDKLHKGQCPKNNLERKSMENVSYAALVGSLMYAQVCTRPDISFAVNMLSRYQSNAGQEHWIAGKKVLRYLMSTKDHMLVFRKLEDQELEVECYTDASYKQDFDDLKSTSGYIFMLAGGAISWKTNKQELTATSTFQAEYVAIFEATAHALWLRNFIARMRVVDSIERPMVLYCDNAAAVFFSKNNKRTSGSRNIDVKYFSVRESVRDNEVAVIKIGTREQLADPLTKALPVSAFIDHVKNMGVLSDFND